MDATAGEFTLAMCNVLAEQPYRKWSKTTLIPAAQRQALLAKAFSDPATFGKADVICLMEWDQYHLEQTLRQQGWEWINPRTPSARWGTTIAYRRDKFSLEANTFGSVDGRYEFAAARLRHTTSGNILGVVSCHLPFSGPGAALTAILARAAEVLSTRSVVVCGDFNSTDAASFQPIMPEYVSAMRPEWPTSRSPSDHFIAIDYVWHRALESVAARIEPDLTKPNGMRLVAHAAGGTQTGDYFSDHCVLNVHFRFKKN